MTLTTWTKTSGSYTVSVRQDKGSACWTGTVSHRDGYVVYRYNYYTSEKSARSAMLRILKKL